MVNALHHLISAHCIEKRLYSLFVYTAEDKK
jgi:hypothetical protein